MNLGNTCALICRALTLLLLASGAVLSTLAFLSCLFLSARSSPTETHGVGLHSYESESTVCLPHSAFIQQHYNGMETAAMVGGLVAPSLAALVLLWLSGECCKKNGEPCWSGKCLPMLGILGAIVGQSLTFLLFQSELFCGQETCEMGQGGYRSLQACLVYAATFVVYYCAPNPTSLASVMRGHTKRDRMLLTPSTDISEASTSKSSNNNSNSSNSKKKKKKKKQTAASSKKSTLSRNDGEYTKEMYEQRRKEKKDKSRGVSGRKKKEMIRDLKEKDNKKFKEDENDNMEESRLTLYDPDRRKEYDDHHHQQHPRRSGSVESQERYDDYVDEPDGMDWSAYTPGEREAYLERKRRKRRQHEEEREQRKIERLREREGEERRLERQYNTGTKTQYKGHEWNERTKEEQNEMERLRGSEDKRLDRQYDRETSQDGSEYYDARDRGHERHDRGRGHHEMERLRDREDRRPGREYDRGASQDGTEYSDARYRGHERYYDKRVRYERDEYDRDEESYQSDYYSPRREYNDHDGSYISGHDDSYISGHGDSYISGHDDYSDAYNSRVEEGYGDPPGDNGRYVDRRSVREDYSYGYDGRAEEYYDSPRRSRKGYYS